MSEAKEYVIVRVQWSGNKVIESRSFDTPEETIAFLRNMQTGGRPEVQDHELRAVLRLFMEERGVKFEVGSDLWERATRALNQ